MMFHVEHTPLPVPSLKDIAALAAELGISLGSAQVALTRAHLVELARWNATTSLVQAGSVVELLERHVAEGWLAAQLLPPYSPMGRPLCCLDVGSGGGFPGLPLHVLRPDIELSLVEPRQRKAAFLRAVARHHLEPRPQVLECRLEDLGAGQTWDVISFRGIKLDPTTVLPHLVAGGLILRFPSRPDRESAAWSAARLSCRSHRDLPTHGLRVEAWSSG